MRASKILLLLVAPALLMLGCSPNEASPATLIATVSSSEGSGEVAADESPRIGDDVPSSRIPPTWTPAPTAEGPQELPAQPTRPPDETYVVQPGDTLAELAEQFDVDLQRLVSANDIQNIDFIFSGQVLTIPR